MDFDLMNRINSLANEVDSLLAPNRFSDTKVALIRQHLRNAFEWILIGEFDHALPEINLASQLIHEPPS